jgi:hypothetical protein
MGNYFINLTKAVFALAPEKRTPWFLRPKRYARRVRLAMFRGKTPDWAKDTYKLIKYINLLELIPTFGALTTTPMHFFRRLPAIRNGKKTWYKTPLAFLSLMVVAGYSCVEFVHPHAVYDLAYFTLRWMMDHDHFWVLDFLKPFDLALGYPRIATYLILLIVCFLSPLWILPPCLLLGCIAWVLEEYKARRSDSIFVKASGLNPHIMLIPLDVRVYWRMRPMAFAWGLFYFGLYALFVVVVFVNLVAQGPPPYLTYLRGFGVFFLFSYYTTLIAAIQFFLARPYAALLRATSTPPTRRMGKADAHALISVLRQIRTHVSRQSKSRRDKPELWKISAIDELRKEWDAYSLKVKQEVLINLRNSSVLTSSLRQDQKKIFCRALPIDKVRDAISFVRPFEKNPGNLEVVMRGLESLYAGNGVPSSMTDGTGPMALSPTPAA